MANCRKCGKKVGLMNHAIRCPRCRKFWCGKCAVKQKGGFLICPRCMVGPRGPTAEDNSGEGD